jgi:hypothetical protein
MPFDLHSSNIFYYPTIHVISNEVRGEIFCDFHGGFARRKRFLSPFEMTVCLLFSYSRAFKTQFGKAILNFRTAHKQLPQQAGTVIFDHHNDRSLVNSQV